MDAFAVAIVSGIALNPLTRRQVFRLSFHFGLFQALMPILGWALGVGAFECLTGRKPFAGDNTTTILFKIVSEEAPPLELDALRGFGPGTRSVLDRALAKDPARRFASGEELAAALRACKDPARPALEGETTALLPRRPNLRPPRRLGWRLGLGAAALAAAVGAWSTLRRPKPAPAPGVVLPVAAAAASTPMALRPVASVPPAEVRPLPKAPPTEPSKTATPPPHLPPGPPEPDLKALTSQVAAAPRHVADQCKVLLAADPAACRELGRAQVCGPNWCNPAYANGRLYVRSLDKMAAFDVKGRSR